MIPNIADKDKFFAWMVANKMAMIAQKKANMKCADSFSSSLEFLISSIGGVVVKAEGGIPKDAPSIDVVSVINTTKLFDSHGDVHFDGLWNKSIKENKDNYLVKEHDFRYDGIISDQVKVTAPIVSWKDLGYDYKGETQALTYTSTITKDDSTGMFDKYRTGKVKQHSVGMRYVKLDLALPTKKYEEEYKIWKNYFDQIVNPEEADKAGYFWAVTEAKNIEGSAVLRGANFATPTRSVQESKEEPVQTTPIKSREKSTLNMDDLLKYYQPNKHI